QPQPGGHAEVGGRQPRPPGPQELAELRPPPPGSGRGAGRRTLRLVDYHAVLTSVRAHLSPAQRTTLSGTTDIPGPSVCPHFRCARSPGPVGPTAQRKPEGDPVALGTSEGPRAVSVI